MSEANLPPTDRSRQGAEVLPPVQPPTSGFLLQLFFIPLVIVLIIVVVWMLFSWLAHMGTSPRELVRELSRRNNASWQRAVTLAQILESAPTGDPNGVRHDRQMAGELARILKDVYDSGAKDDSSVKLQEFLCSALGNFEVDDGLGALIAVAAKEKEDVLLPVRTAAVNGLAELLARLIDDPQSGDQNLKSLRANTTLNDLLLETTRDVRDSSTPTALKVDEIRSRAAFALGLVGTDEGLDRLAVMIQDRSSNARNNAAFGLARHGDVRALPEIVAMLDPSNDSALLHEDMSRNEKPLSEAEIALNKDWKRTQVLQNGLSTAKLLITRNKTDDLTALKAPIDALTRVELTFYRQNLSEGFKHQTIDDLRAKAEGVQKLLEERGLNGK